MRRLAPGRAGEIGVVVALAALLAGACGGGGAPEPDGRVVVDWERLAGPVDAAQFGANTVWSRGGLGLWHDGSNGGDGAVDADVDALVRALAPGLLRYPGGTRAMRWHFARTIGAPATRAPQCDTFTGAVDASGWGLDEFLRWAEDLGVEVTLVAPWVDGSPQETAALVAYVNGDASSAVVIGADSAGTDWGTAGQWAALRGENGHPAPYRVRFLEVGNEPYLDQRVGPDPSCGRPGRFTQAERWVGDTRIPTTAADYAAQLAITAALVRQIDPDLAIGAAGFSRFDADAPGAPASDAATEVGDVDTALATGDAWNARLVADAGDAFDFWVLHPYDFSTGDARLTLPARLARVAAQLRALAPGKDIAVTEFGFLIGGNTLANALVSADMVRAGHDLGLRMTVRHILIEDDAGGPFAESAAILGPAHVPQPGYLAGAELRAALVGRLAPLTLTAASPGADLDALTAMAARADAVHGGACAVALVDLRADGGAVRRVAVTLPPGRWTGSVRTLTGPYPDAVVEQLERREQVVTDASGELVVEVPPLALVVVRLSPAAAPP